ncbi:MAG: DoxX family protein [Sphingobacteriales bacterium]|nr:MAG: DoxX family protein [Sphingobacteriales bacterium]
MKANKSTIIVYWISTSIIFLWEGLMPALTGHTELAVEGVRHLGYPDYFRVMLNISKVAASIVLILPFFSARLKEWAYVGLGITMLSACVSHIAVDGFSGMSLFPLIIFAILVVSYVTYHRLQSYRSQQVA